MKQIYLATEAAETNEPIVKVQAGAHKLYIGYEAVIHGPSRIVYRHGCRPSIVVETSALVMLDGERCDE